MSDRFPNVFIHPSAEVEDGVEIGEGSKIWHLVHVRRGARIGVVEAQDAPAPAGSALQLTAARPAERGPDLRRLDPALALAVVAEPGGLQDRRRPPRPGREPIVATKGVMVQVPYRTLYQIENVGTEPALRFEVNVTRARRLYPMDETPAPVPGFEYVPTRVTGGRGSAGLQ